MGTPFNRESGRLFLFVGTLSCPACRAAITCDGDANVLNAWVVLEALESDGRFRPLVQIRLAAGAYCRRVRGLRLTFTTGLHDFPPVLGWLQF